MNDGPRRLFDGGDEMSDLLRSAMDAERSDDADTRRLERIGRGLAAATAAPIPTTTMHTAPANAQATTAARTGFFAGKGPVVLLAIAGMGGLAALGLRGGGVSGELSAPASAIPSAVVSAAPAMADEPPTMSPSDLPSAPIATVTVPARANGKQPPSAASVEGDEIALLARAHDALHSSPAQELVLCKEHESRWARGQFAQEREAVAIEALVDLGRRDEAGRRWTAFQGRYPTSSHRVHLERLLAAPAAQ